jgi:ATP-dependent Clp protease ATP-binding subunit ClpC
LWGDPECLAVLALERFGITREQAKARIVELLPPGDNANPQVPVTPRAWVAVSNTVTEAVALGHNYVGTEHVLLALLGGVGGVAADVLAEHDVDHDRAKEMVVELLSGYPAN